MKLIHTVKELKAELSDSKHEGKTIGLIPTMGALHAGHLSLVKKSVEENDLTIVSVFVNPTQFNDKSDLIAYPRSLSRDTELLGENRVDYIFAPNEEEIYPEPDTRVFKYPPLDTVMEGAFRPGHFNGVCQVVSKLFSYVRPNNAYFGEKDFQQLAIVRKMAAELFPDLTIVGCPIVREADGLALSSRNERLNAEQRQHALTISKALFDSVEFSKDHSLAETLQFITDAIASDELLELEYFKIVDGDTLQPITKWEDTSYAVGCITVFCGDVRLIDNITYKYDKK